MAVGEGACGLRAGGRACFELLRAWLMISAQAQGKMRRPHGWNGDHGKLKPSVEMFLLFSFSACEFRKVS